MEKNILKSQDGISAKTLLEPWITEAATLAMEKNKYIFKVGNSSTKKEIKRSVEEVFQVKVVNVRTMNIFGKKKIRGRIEGKKADFKKAIVTIASGSTINFYEGK